MATRHKTMIPENYKSEKVESKSFPLLKNDVYQVQLTGISVSKNKKYKSEELEDVFSFEFAVLAGKDAEGNDARGRLLNKNFVPTYLFISTKNGKNDLYKIIEAFKGRELTQQEEAEGISGKYYNGLIGHQIRVLLEKVQSKKDASKFYSNISNFLTADSDFTPLTLEELKVIEETKEKNKQNQANPSVPVTSTSDKAIEQLNDERNYTDEEVPDELRVENIPF